MTVVDFCVEVIVVPRKESSAVNVVDAERPGVRRIYVAHLGLIGIGVKISKLGSKGGCPCLSFHGS